MNKVLSMALVGCGDISERYVSGCQSAPHIHLKKVMDVQPEAIRRITDKYGIPGTTDYEEILADPGIDAVMISGPHYLHAPLTIRAARAGKHVMCDKPLATTEADGKKMIRVCREKKVALSVALGMRTRGTSIKARELISRGAIGKIIMVTFSLATEKPAAYWNQGYTHVVKTDWRGSKEKAGGGFVIMNFSHNIDLIRYVTGLEVASVRAEVDTMVTPVEVEDVASIIFRYENGAIGNLAGGTVLQGNKRGIYEPVRIYGTHGQLQLPGGWREPLAVYTRKKMKDLTCGAWNTFTPHELTGIRRSLLDDFAVAVLKGKTPPITGEDGLAALRAVLAAYRSGATGRTVRLRHTS